MNQRSRTTVADLQNGQTWRFEDGHLLISLVGKHLVQYKLFRGETKRTPTSMSPRKAVEKYLRENKAVLVRR
ncbi:MAG: hypothetical protein DME25_13750 [Verrucomicrobia bacterium]|nr:MAG: hypothetical protein DME25_13750 [Verrucomicrobiota bacterium]